MASSVARSAHNTSWGAYHRARLGMTSGVGVNHHKDLFSHTFHIGFQKLQTLSRVSGEEIRANRLLRRMQDCPLEAVALHYIDSSEGLKRFNAFFDRQIPEVFLAAYTIGTQEILPRKKVHSCLSRPFRGLVCKLQAARESSVI